MKTVRKEFEKVKAWLELSFRVHRNKETIFVKREEVGDATKILEYRNSEGYVEDCEIVEVGKNGITIYLINKGEFVENLGLNDLASIEDRVCLIEMLEEVNN